MKKYFFLLAGLLTAVLSCNKQNALPPLPEPAAITEDSGTLHVSVGTADTKASLSGLDDESIRCLQVLIFNADTQKLETDKYVSASSASLTSPVGNKHVWAIVNHSRLTNVTTETALKSTVTSLAENYTTGSGIHLVMAGEKDVEVTQSSNQVNIDVTRLVSKIVLTAVTRKFADTFLAGSSFTIKDVYLKNVAGNTNFSLDKKNNGTEWDILAPSSWFNPLTDANDATVSPLLCDHNLSIACAENTATSMNRVWYTCPNPTSDDSTSSSWCARHTRLVIHADVSGTQTYYTFTLPVLKRNCSYEISNITFTMLGKDNDNDDTVTDTGAASITLNVVDWDTSTALTYDI